MKAVSIALIALFISSAAAADDSWLAPILLNDPTIPEVALRLAFKWLEEHPENFPNHEVLTIIDFSASSRTKRMHVVNLTRLESTRYLVAHGKNSGYDVPTQFSNEEGSNMSSLGVYTTLDPYRGDHGLSLRLRGLESTNDQAENRLIVLHGADYVSDAVAASQDRLGRSLGCPTVDLAVVDQLVPQLQGGSLLLIYSLTAIP